VAAIQRNSIDTRTVFSLDYQLMSQKPNYGIDSPVIIGVQLTLAAIAFLVAFLSPHLLGLPMRWIGLLTGLYFAQGVLGMLHYSLAGKMKIRDRLLNLLVWRGDEMVLDVGCGRGLLLIAAAQRLTTGKAIGVDVWVAGAVIGNCLESAVENAALQGVSERVEVKHGDARQLPFAGGTFDVVVSNFVLHEMETAADRVKMVREMVRVLKPGGHLALADFIFTGQCMRELEEAGLLDVKRLRTGRIAFWLSAIASLGSFQLGLISGKKDVSPANACGAHNAIACAD